MARYNTFKYGTGVEYGVTSPALTSLLWSVLVDWDADGYYSGENEAFKMVGFRSQRGRRNFIRSNFSGFERYTPGEAILILDNTDGRYDPYNTSSPLYPNVSPGKLVRIAVQNGTSGLAYSIMRGTISDIQPYNQGSSKMTAITVQDGLNWLSTQPVLIGKQENVVFGTLVKTVLDACQFPSTEWSYPANANGNVIPFFWAKNKPALEVIRELEDAEGGVFRQNTSGTFVWSAKTTDIVSTTTVTESEILKDVTTPQPWDSVINQVRVVVNPLTSHNITATIWELEKVVSIPAGTSYTVEVFFQHPTLSIPICQDNIDSFLFAVNTQADGAGSDITSSCVLSHGAAGESVILTFANNNASAGFLISASIVGDAIYALYSTVVTANDATSQELHGVRTLEIESPWMQRSEAVGTPWAAYLVEELKDPNLVPVIKIENRPTIQFALDLYLHGVRLQLASTGLDRIFRIGIIEHEWLNDNGQAVRTTWGLEPYLTPYS